MPKRHFTRGQSTYFCSLCHKETRDTGRGEENMGICWLCYTINEWDNLHSDEDHEASFDGCSHCLAQMSAEQIKHLPYYMGDKSYPTI